METRRDVYQAIADPTRRSIIQLLSRGSMNLNSIADKFEVSRQAVSLHIKILNECGLVAIKKQGRERYCEAHLQKLKEVSKWTEQYSSFWTSKLDALGSHLDQEQKLSKRKVNKKTAK